MFLTEILVEIIASLFFGLGFLINRFVVNKKNKGTKTLKKGVDSVEHLIPKFKNELQEQWDRGSGSGGFIAMNVGITAVIRMTEFINEYLII